MARGNARAPGTAPAGEPFTAPLPGRADVLNLLGPAPGLQSTTVTDHSPSPASSSSDSPHHGEILMEAPISLGPDYLAVRLARPRPALWASRAPRAGEYRDGLHDLTGAVARPPASAPTAPPCWRCNSLTPTTSCTPSAAPANPCTSGTNSPSLRITLAGVTAVAQADTCSSLQPRGIGSPPGAPRRVGRQAHTAQAPVRRLRVPHARTAHPNLIKIATAARRLKCEWNFRAAKSG